MKLTLYKKDILGRQVNTRDDIDVLKLFIDDCVIRMIKYMAEEAFKNNTKRLKQIDRDYKIDSKKFILDAIDRIDVKQTSDAFILTFIKDNDDPLSDDCLMRVLLFGSLTSKSRLTFMQDIFDFIESNIHQIYVDWFGGI